MDSGLEPEMRPGVGGQNDNRTPMNVGGDVVKGDKIVIQKAGGDIVDGDKITNVSNYFQAPAWGDVKHRHNRQAMIKNVRDFWIKGVLENSLYGAVIIQLGLDYKPDAVQQPWNLNLRQPKQADQVIPSNTRKIEIFDQANGALLILGAPGSGKTTTLLELARDLLDRADKEETASIPVVFSLASWAVRRSPLVDWLIDELFKRYDVPPKVGKTWVEQDMIIPLLDGLDEVQAQHRDACVRAIDAFRADHGLAPLAVCSRIVDYEALNTQLRLRAAVVVQALSLEQIIAHLAQFGASLSVLRQAIQERKDLRELAATPLMLGVMMVVYQGEPSEIGLRGSIGEQGRALFARYVESMLERTVQIRVYVPDPRTLDTRDSRPQFAKTQSLHWLSWLAKTMKRYDQTMLYLEFMQPTWLPTRRQARTVTLGTSLMVGLAVTLVLFGPILLSRISLEIPALRTVLISQLIFVGLFSRLAYSPTIETVEILRLQRPSPRKILAGMGRGGAVGFGIGLVVSLELVIAILTASSTPAFTSDIIQAALVVTLAALFTGLIGGAIGAFVGGLLSYISTAQISARRRPNEGVRRSALSAFFGTLVVGLISGLIFWPISALSIGSVHSVAPSSALTLEVVQALSVGLIFGLMGGLAYGGRACLQHIVLRLLLWWNGAAPRPWDYVTFLDYAADRVLLRKVGGGYIFIHPLVMDYFAAI